MHAVTRYSLILCLLSALLSIPVQDAFAHHPGVTPEVSTQIGTETGISSGAMVNSPSASTLGKGQIIAGLTWDAVRYNSIPATDANELHEAGRDIHGKNHEEFYNLHVGYGLSDDLDLFVIVPLVSKTSIQIEDEDQLGRGERASGIGDLRLLAKYQFWHEGIEAALLAGFKAPTGEVSDHDQSGAKFEPEQQSGSGSWDGEFGLAISRSFRKHLSLATSFQYTLKGEGAQDRKFGDIFRYNVGAGYAFRPLGQRPNLSLVLELNSEWALRGHSRTEDRVLDSGGTSIFITPGLTADLTEHLSAFLAMPVPIYQNLGGEHEELKYGLLTGMSWRF